MSEYDAALKLLFRQFAPATIQLLTGTPITTWLDQELPKTQNLRLDPLGRDAASNLELEDLMDESTDSRLEPEGIT